MHLLEVWSSLQAHWGLFKVWLILQWFLCSLYKEKEKTWKTINVLPISLNILLPHINTNQYLTIFSTGQSVTVLKKMTRATLMQMIKSFQLGWMSLQNIWTHSIMKSWIIYWFFTAGHILHVLFSCPFNLI